MGNPYHLGAGNITLGCLLGQYDKAQSFDVASAPITTAVNSWRKVNAQSSADFALVQPHSSSQTLNTYVFSGGDPIVYEYIHGTGNDAYARWFTEIDTHAVRSRAWVTDQTNATSGFVSFKLNFATGEVAYPIAESGARVAIVLDTNVASHSAGPPLIRIEKPTAINSIGVDGVRVIIDDVITEIDPIPLHPEWGFRDRMDREREIQRTRGGDLHTWKWPTFGGWTVPLPYLTDSHAALINWWWEQDLALAFTLNTSDAETVHLVKITNDRRPIDSLVKPYHNIWKGTLTLETLTKGGLVF